MPAAARVASTWTKTLVEVTDSRIAGAKLRRDVQVVDLQHGVDEVDERMPRESAIGRRSAVFGEIVAGAVEAQAVVAEPDRLGAVHLRLADHDLDVQAGALLGGPAGRGDDLDRDVRVLPLHLCGGRRGDVGAEAVGRRDPDDAFEGALAAGVGRPASARRTRRPRRPTSASRPRSVSSQPPPTRASSRPPIACSSAAMRREIVVWLMPSSSAAVV